MLPPLTSRAAESVPKMQQMIDTARRRLRVDQKAADVHKHGWTGTLEKLAAVFE